MRVVKRSNRHQVSRRGLTADGSANERRWGSREGWKASEFGRTRPRTSIYDAAHTRPASQAATPDYAEKEAE
ncbi:hypothetical protein ANO11243_089490 [Dothideomycetidae sp. 11243]|nr:hypothetical protein ANO11243_089490 [fungal sp. No.11243]